MTELPRFLSGGGECAALIATRDWSTSPLGAIDGWEQSFKTATALLLRSPAPMVMLWGEDGVMLYNDPYSVFAGGRHPDLLGSKVRQGWPEVADFNDHVMRIVLAGGTLHYVDQELTLHRHGRPEQVWMNLDYSPVLDDQGEPAGVLCVLAETTQRVTAECRQAVIEAELRAERDRAQGVLENMAEGFALLDREFRVLDINAEGMRLENRPRAEIVGRTHWEAWLGSEDSELGRLYKRAMAERTPVALEHRYVWSDGHHAWLELRAYPVGEGLALFYRDVTGRKDAEEALRIAGERAVRDAAEREAILDQLAEGVIVADAHGRITFVNEAAERLHGVKMLGVEPDAYADTYHLLTEAGEPYPPRELPLARAVIDGTTVEDTRWRIRRPDGSEVLAIGSARPLVDADGGRNGAVLTLRDDTARHGAEAERARLVTVIEQSPDFIGIADQHGRGIYINRGARRMCGLADDTDIGDLEIIDFFAPEDRAFIRHVVLPAQASEHGYQGELRFRRFDGGEPVPVSYDGFAIRDGNGRITAFATVTRDVSERVRTEAALRESEARLSFLEALAEATQPLTDSTKILGTTARILGEYLHLSVCAYADMDEDEDGFTIRGDWAAPGAKSIVGHYRLADFGKLAVENLSAGLPLVVNDNLCELAPEEAATFQSIGIAATICMPLVKEGRLVALMAIHDRVPRNWTEAELDLLGEVTARSWAHVERVGAAAELRVSEARLQRALEVGELGAWELDLTTLAAWRSPQHDRIFGYQDLLPEWTYAMFLEHVVPEDRNWMDARFQEAITSGGRWDFECRIRRANGELRWIWAQGKVDTGSDGQPGRMKGMVRDVTERKRTEERLRELNDTLETRVAKRTAELEQAHEQLRQSQKLEAMGQLTGGVAHDFNNLLTPIVGSLDMLQRKGLGSEREQRLISGALQSAERAKTLVQRLLAFARRQPLQPVAVDLRTLVEGMVDLVASTSGPRVNVELDIAPEVPAVRADANQLEMAILNLAVNARDAMRDGGRLTISAKPEAVAAGHRARLAPDQYVRLSISDTGVGMDEATLARAIEPFFSTKGVGKGTGLGLSMAHGLASQLGGALTIQSRLNVGTTIDLWLPIAAGAARSREKPHEATELAAAGTALLIDDEELPRASTADMLSELGYIVVEASSAEEAQRLVADGLAPDLVVTDHLMPGMTGTDFAREVRERHPRAKVLVISGYAEDEGITPDLARLTKPFRQAELATKLAGLEIRPPAEDGRQQNILSPA